MQRRQQVPPWITLGVTDPTRAPFALARLGPCAGLVQVQFARQTYKKGSGSLARQQQTDRHHARRGVAVEPLLHASDNAHFLAIQYLRTDSLALACLPSVRRLPPPSPFADRAWRSFRPSSSSLPTPSLRSWEASDVERAPRSQLLVTSKLVAPVASATRTTGTRTRFSENLLESHRSTLVSS